MSRPTRSRRWSIGRAPLLTTSSVATPRSWPPTARTSHSPRSPAGPVCRSRGYGRYSSVPGWSFVLEAVDAPRVDIARRGSAAQHHRAGLVTRRQVLEGPASRVRGPARSGRGPAHCRRPRRSRPRRRRPPTPGGGGSLRLPAGGSRDAFQHGAISVGQHGGGAQSGGGGGGGAPRGPGCGGGGGGGGGRRGRGAGGGGGVGRGGGGRRRAGGGAG